MPLTPQVQATVLQALSSLRTCKQQSKRAKEPLKSAALLLVLLDVTYREVGLPQNGGAANDLHVNLTESYGIDVFKTIVAPKR